MKDIITGDEPIETDTKVNEDGSKKSYRSDDDTNEELSKEDCDFLEENSGQDFQRVKRRKQRHGSSMSKVHEPFELKRAHLTAAEKRVRVTMTLQELKMAIGRDLCRKHFLRISDSRGGCSGKAATTPHPHHSGLRQGAKSRINLDL